MSTTLSHPFRIDGGGRAVTIAQWSDRHAAETAGHVLACTAGERGLAPRYGLPDPAGDRVDGDEVRAVVRFCEPWLSVRQVTVTEQPTTTAVTVDVGWAITDEEI